MPEGDRLMDASGNLTDVSEFADFRYIRLISYLNPDVAIGAFAGAIDGAYALGVRNVSAGEPEKTVFLVDNSPFFGEELFALSWPAASNVNMFWADNGSTLELGAYYDSNGHVRIDAHPDEDFDPTAFAVDFVDGCWFALNDRTRNHVVDCSGSGTAETNPIVSWPWNGGENQMWRAATKGPGLG